MPGNDAPTVGSITLTKPPRCRPNLSFLPSSIEPSSIISHQSSTVLTTNRRVIDRHMPGGSSLVLTLAGAAAAAVVAVAGAF